MRREFAVALAVVMAAAGAAAQDFLSGEAPATRAVRRKVNVEPAAGAQVPRELEFVDDRGRRVRLAEYLDGDRPVILNLVYYSCPMLCNVALDGLVSAISNIRFDAGDAYEIVTVSFDPRDTPQLARERKAKYVRRYGRPGADGGWHFLTGDEASIRALTRAVGFEYAWDETIGQYGHGAAIFVLTPTGRVAQSFYGIQYPSRELRLALVEASDEKIGSMFDRVLLLCYDYRPGSGRNAAIAMASMRVGGLAAVAGIAGFIVVMLRREQEGKGSGR